MISDDQERLPSERMQPIARLLAMACMAGVADPLEIRQRCFTALNQSSARLAALTQDLVYLHGALINARDIDALSAAIMANPHFRSCFQSDVWPPEAAGYFVFEPHMLEAPAPLGALHMPALPTPGDLARWLGISSDELEWLADPAGWRQRHQGPLCHYRYRWIKKRDGSARLLEIPKSQLRRLQRQILTQILERVPTHNAAHGSVKQRSIFSNAAPHAGHASLLRIDLSGFFTTIRASRVQAIFRTLGFPPPVARYLAAITTTATPSAVLLAEPSGDISQVRRARQLDRSLDYRARHLPQGAPSSPTLANLSAWRLDVRLQQASEASEVYYTRYVDDLFYSSNALDRRRMQRFATMVYRIISEEGFRPNFHKTRFMARSTSQRVTGLVVNTFPNVSRASFDELKAILTNCIRLGPDQQNRLGTNDFKAHLLGRIAFVEQANASRGAKLRALMNRIRWNAGAP